MDDPRTDVVEHPLPRYPTYSAICCRRWDLAVGFPVGRCALCGVKPVALN